MNEDRILAYKKAHLLTNEELLNITGGSGTKGTVQIVNSTTGVPPSDVQITQIYD